MAQEKTVVFSLELDTRALKKNAKEAEVALVDLVEKQKDLRKEGKQNTVEYVQLTEQIRINQKALKDNAQALQIQETLAGKTELTNKELMLVQKALAVEYNNLTEEQRENTIEGQKIAKQYKAVNDALNENSLAVGDGRRNVGLYKKAIIEANKEINSLKKEVTQIGFVYGKTSEQIDENTKAMNKMAEAGDTTSAEFKQLETETAKLNEQLVFQEQALKGATTELENQELALEKTKEEAQKIGFVYGEQPKTLRDYRMELKELQTVMLNMDANSEEYIEASERAGELRDKIKEVAENQKAMTGGTGFEKMSSTMGMLKDDLMNLDFAGVSEKAKALQQISTKMTFKEALGGLKDMGSSLISLGKTILANPLFIMVAVIGAVVGALMWFSDETAELKEEQDRLNQSFEREQFLLELKTNAYLKSGKQRLEVMEAEGKSEKELHSQRMQNIIAEEFARQDEVSLIASQLAKQKALYKKALEDGDEDLIKSVGDRIKTLRQDYLTKESMAKDYQHKLKLEDIAYNKFLDEQKKEELKKEKEKLDKQREANKKFKEDQKKGVEERLAMEKEAIQNLRDLYLKNLELTTQNELDIVNNKYATLELMAEGNLEALLKLQEEKTAEISAINQKELENQKQAIENNYADQLSSLNDQLKKTKELKKIATKEELQNIEEVEEKIKEEKIVLEKNKLEEIKNLTIQFEGEIVKNTQKTEDIKEEIRNEKSQNRITQLEAEFLREQNALRKSGVSESQIFELTKQKQIDIETEKNNQIQSNQDLSNEEKFKAQQEYEAKIIDLNQKSADEQVRIEEEKRAKILEASQFALAQIQAISDSYFEIAQSNINKEIEANQRKEDQLRSDLEARLEAGIISEEQYEIQKQKIDATAQEENKKLQKEAFEIQKKSQLATAVLSGANAILQALASSPPPFSYVLAGITAGLTAIQVAQINNQEPPEFAEGGLTGQLITSRDGKAISRPNGDNLIATVKTGEIITNKRQQKFIESVAGSDIWSRAGVKGFASGGFTGAQISNRVDTQIDGTRMVMEALSNLPTPVVLVQDIVDAQTNLTKVEDSANF